MMGLEMSYLTKCRDCGIKLRSRNIRKRRLNGYKSRQLCQHCFGHPMEKDMCEKIKSNGERCKMRKKDNMVWCTYHAPKGEENDGVTDR